MKHGTQYVKDTEKQAQRQNQRRSTAVSAVKPFARWLVRLKWYTNRGLYYVGDFNVILPIGMAAVTRSILDSVLVYLSIQLVACVAGFVDFHYLHRIQYDEYLNTRANPYLVNLIKKRS